MSTSRFQKFMTAIDEELLEEAQTPKKKIPALRFVSIAACICAGVLVANLLLPHLLPGDSDISVVSAEELKEYGYDMPVPEDAKEVTYYLKEQEAHSIPMAQVSFTAEGVEYVCSAQITQAAQVQEAAETKHLIAGNHVKEMELWVEEAEEFNSVSWYMPESEIQWKVESAAKEAKIFTVASYIMQTLGLDMSVAPVGAGDVSYNILEVEDLTVAETIFRMEDINYSFRTAATFVIEEEFADISGVTGDYQCSGNAEIGWCSARVYYTPGAAGKIVWFDIAPGLLYSLSMDTGASEEKLIEMAESLYNPVQGEVP